MSSGANMDAPDMSQVENLNTSTKPLVQKTSSSSQSHHHKKKKPHELIIQVLPPSPTDFCTCFDSCCLDFYKLSIMTTFLCWLPLGLAPVLIGILGIYYASKARSTKNEAVREKYKNRSLTISWIGMLLFTMILTCVVIVLATSGIL